MWRCSSCSFPSSFECRLLLLRLLLLERDRDDRGSCLSFPILSKEVVYKEKMNGEMDVDSRLKVQ